MERTGANQPGARHRRRGADSARPALGAAGPPLRGGPRRDRRGGPRADRDAHAPDIVILDLTLPGMSGLEACRTLREWYHGPILILSVRNADDDKIAALDLGADDYLTKPFSTGELLARLRALLRRTQGADASVSEIRSGDLCIDFAKRSGHRRGRAGPSHAHRVRHPGFARSQRRPRRDLADAAREGLGSRVRRGHADAAGARLAPAPQDRATGRRAALHPHRARRRLPLRRARRRTRAATVG